MRESGTLDYNQLPDSYVIMIMPSGIGGKHKSLKTAKDGESMTKLKKYTILILLIFLLAITFCMSAKSVDQSARMSYNIDRWICSLFTSNYEELPYERQTELAIGLDFWVRKSAHFLEYTALGVLLYLVSKLFFKSGNGRCFVLSFCAGTAWAVLDEFHQYFVPGRSCELRNMTIDAAGVLLGVTTAAIIRYRKRRPASAVLPNSKND